MSVLNPEGVCTFALRLADRVAFTLDLGRFRLVLSGDCRILLARSRGGHGHIIAVRRGPRQPFPDLESAAVAMSENG